MPPGLDDVFNDNEDRVRQDSDVRSGDVCRLSTTIYLYSKTEKVKEKGKLVDVMTYGAALQLDGVKIVVKNGGGDTENEFGDDDEGDAPARPAQRVVTKADVKASAGIADDVNSDGDF